MLSLTVSWPIDCKASIITGNAVPPMSKPLYWPTVNRSFRLKSFAISLRKLYIIPVNSKKPTTNTTGGTFLGLVIEKNIMPSKIITGSITISGSRLIVCNIYVLYQA